mmetsp:Transcript_56371/g.64646  ORF Transcript_56371/g.64646 Transcript_56371/m.64646 type:complete len:267 (+) Transcript_56371:13-813(+)
MGFKEFFNKHKTKILAATGVVAVGAVVIFFLSKKGKSSSATQKQLAQQGQIPDASTKIRIAYIPETDILTKECLVEIHALLAQRTSAYYLKVAQDARKERRKHIDDIPRYIAECNKLQESLQKNITSVLAKIAEELKITPEVYQFAYEYHTKKEGNEEFLDKVAVPDPNQNVSTRALTQADVLKVYNHHSEIMEKVIVDLAKSQKSAEELEHLVEFRLADLTALQFGIEEEELLSKVNAHLQENAEVKTALANRDSAKKTYFIRHA